MPQAAESSSRIGYSGKGMRYGVRAGSSTTSIGVGRRGGTSLRVRPIAIAPPPIARPAIRAVTAIEIHRLRLRVDLCDFRFAQFNDVSGSDEIARARRVAIHRHEPVANERLEARARKGGKRFGEKPIEALAGVRVSDGELVHG